MLTQRITHQCIKKAGCIFSSGNKRTFSDGLLDKVVLQKATQKIYDGILGGERWALARAITLVESTNKEKKDEARKLMALISQSKPQDKSSFRIGLSGPPGAGKSTFIEAFGQFLTQKDLRVAVLAVDPSSGTTGGSLLGDKTRMPELSRNPLAYIRPSPSSGHLGGVTRTMNEAIVLCETSGYDIVLVETVGVGQSEYQVAQMVDCFCLILAPAAGDELQGIKRGIVEQSDLILVNKADGDLLPSARRTATEYTSALKFMRPRSKVWKSQVKIMSSRTGEGISEVWQTLCDYKNIIIDTGELTRRRAEQRKNWMWTYIQSHLLVLFNNHPGVQQMRQDLESQVLSQTLEPGIAADILIQKFLKDK